MTSMFLDETLLAFALFYFVLQGQTYLLLQVSLDFPLWHSNPYDLFLVLVQEGIVDLLRTIQLQLLQHWYMGHRLTGMLNGLSCI